MRGKHPVKLTLMDQHRNADGTLWLPHGGGCANLATDPAASPPDYRYVPEELPVLHRGIGGFYELKGEVPADVKSTAEKDAELRLRIRNKEKLKAKSTRQIHIRLRVKSSPGCLAKTVSDPVVGAPANEGCDADAMVDGTWTAARARIGTGCENPGPYRDWIYRRRQGRDTPEVP